MFDGLVTVYKNNIDVFIYVIGAASENELILAGVLNTLVDTLNIVLRFWSYLSLLGNDSG